MLLDFPCAFLTNICNLSLKLNFWPSFLILYQPPPSTDFLSQVIIALNLPTRSAKAFRLTFGSPLPDKCHIPSTRNQGDNFKTEDSSYPDLPGLPDRLPLKSSPHSFALLHVLWPLARPGPLALLQCSRDFSLALPCAWDDLPPA